MRYKKRTTSLLNIYFLNIFVIKNNSYFNLLFEKNQFAAHLNKANWIIIIWIFDKKLRF